MQIIHKVPVYICLFLIISDHYNVYTCQLSWFSRKSPSLTSKLPVSQLEHQVLANLIRMQCVCFAFIEIHCPDRPMFSTKLRMKLRLQEHNVLTKC